MDVPDAFWPIPIDSKDPVTLTAFIEAFKTEHYEICSDAAFEDGYEKVAIYVDQSSEPTHAARQLPSGVWTSKMGKGEDIEHDTLEVIENIHYGKPKIFLKRPNLLCQKQNKRKTLFSRLLEFLRTLLKRFSPTAKRNQTSS